MVFLLRCLLFLALLETSVSSKALGLEVEFKADYYSRDLTKNTTIGKGNAWVKSGNRQIWADEIEIDMNRKLATANGNVRLEEGDYKISATHASAKLDSDYAVLDDAVLSSDQMILQGSTLEKTSPNHFRLTEGSYTNCNVKMVSAENFSSCRPDWRLYGKVIEVELEGYAHIYDAIIYVKQLPVFYTPYLVVPAKTKRTSGLLTPGFLSTTTLGSGFSIPYFWAMGEWHDLTITPTFYSEVGYHVGLNYRYVYSPGKLGTFKFSFTQRRFSDNINNPAPDDPSKPRVLGLIGEAAISMRNVYRWGRRNHSQQSIRLVTDPYYTFDYAGDVEGTVHSGYLRSQLAWTFPSDNLLFTAQIQHYQSLIISRDEGTDRGAPVELPNLSYSHSTTPFLGKFFSYEWNLNFTNFYRREAFDQVPLNPSNIGVNTDADPSFDANDYLRTGRRLSVEPVIIANLPIGQSLKLQPQIRAGGVLYHFDHPTGQVVHREFLEIEIPFSVYLSRTFNLAIKGFEKVKHIFQPRIVYANRPFENLSENHPFFFNQGGGGLSNPRFDLRDRFSKFEFIRFELINRFYRKSGSSISRFFGLKISQIYNLRTFQTDPRFSRRLGPIEILSDLTIWRFVAQLQGSYELETDENSWSVSLTYFPSGRDSLKINFLTRSRLNRADTAQTTSLTFYKELPIFFDLSGSLEYSMKEGEVVRYDAAFIFRDHPRTCWEIILRTGQNSLKQTFVGFNFQLYFGTLGGAPITLTL